MTPTLETKYVFTITARIAEVTTADVPFPSLMRDLGAMGESNLVVERRRGLNTNETALGRFLLHDRKGHCEYFATAMAVLLRHAGIPSRVVNGFASGEWSSLTDSYIVRQSDERRQQLVKQREGLEDQLRAALAKKPGLR